MRLLLGLVAIILTLGAGIPSAPVEMTAHCSGHEAGAPSHHSPEQHQHHSDSHCPAHSCASMAPCITVSSLIAARQDLSGATAGDRQRLTTGQSAFASRATPPTPPPPRVRLD